MRRRRGSGDGGDYDSVLDTMTNVVGILIIVVAVTQLNVSSAVGRARSALIDAGKVIDHAPVSDQALATARGERDTTRTRLQELRSLAGSDEGTVGASEREWMDLKGRLRASPNQGPEQIQELQRQARDLEERLRVLRREISTLRDRRDRTFERVQSLAAELEALGGREVPRTPPMQMRLPDPDLGRTKGRERRTFVVKGGRVYLWDSEPLLEKWRRGIDAARRSRPAWLIDAKAQLSWLARYWNNENYTNGTIRLRFHAVPNAKVKGGWDLILAEELAPNAVGTSLAGLAGRTSAFQRALARSKPGRHWHFFHVYEDSFEIYIAARTLAEDRGFAVGWEPWALGQQLQVSLLTEGGGRAAKSD